MKQMKQMPDTSTVKSSSCQLFTNEEWTIAIVLFAF
jgi:hypothetical protein